MTEPPEGGDGEVITGYFGGMRFELTIRGGDSEFPIEIIQLPDEDSSEWRMSRGTSAVPSVLTELQPFIVVVTIPEGDTLTNVDSVPLESNEGIDLTEAFNLRMPGLIPNLHPIRLQDEDEMVIGAITSVLLELTPTNNQVETDAGGEPEPPDDESVLEFTDPSDDATDCATGETVDDPAVDIQSVSVRQVDTRVEVEVSMVQSPRLSFRQVCSMAVILLWFGYEGLVEFHAGERRQGQTDSSGNVIPGTEDAVTVTDDAVTFTVTDGASIPDGSPLEVRAFHTETEGGDVNCDEFIDELSLN